ncbi:dienelactone hydrolase family protein [Mycobacterium sp. NPDC006124]|uniref:dienelactone hydrolase family protein n=1 Tax=Mycobacterium sp. NPDC006124 TaxID=3156729 RepID=UPI0033B861A7
MSVTQDVTYTVDGMTMVGHLARPDGAGPWPAVLIGHDGVGLDAYQRRRADILADHGFVAFAMDYHGGRTYFGQPQEMLDRTMPLLDDTGRMLAIGRAALEILVAVPGVDTARLAALGYGAGGQIVLELACAGTSFTAVAVVHPALPANARAEDWSRAGGAFLLCTGSEDPLCTPAQLLTFGTTLHEAGVDWRVAVFGGAEHAFWAVEASPGNAHDSTGPVATVPGVSHHPVQARRAWDAVLDFLRDEVPPAGDGDRPAGSYGAVD